jgi:2'-5' RNA ligase
MRIFVALEIPEAVRTRIASFIDHIREFAPQARWVRSESLHLTLKFIGEKQPAEVERIIQSLAEIKGEGCFDVVFRGSGFFPNPKAARVLWVGIKENSHLTKLANLVDEACGKAGVAREEREFNPHLTLARAGSSGVPYQIQGDRKKRTFEKLQERLAEMETPDFGTMKACEFILYHSKLSPRGAHYTALARFLLEKS